MKNCKLLAVVWVIMLGFPAFSQTQNNVTTRPVTRNVLLSGATIDSQFIHLTRISKTQEDFKLVRRTNLELLRKNVNDSIAGLRQQINTTQSQLPGMTAEIAQLRDSLNHSRQRQHEAEQAKHTVGFAGLTFSIMTYQLIVWGIIAFLTIVLVFILLRFNQHRSAASDAGNTLAELQAEYDAHRKKALEKEQKLMRRLQDEINRGNA